LKRIAPTLDYYIDLRRDRLFIRRLINMIAHRDENVKAET